MLATFTTVNGVTLAGVILGVIVAFGLVVAYFRANLGKSTIEIYKADNDALRGRVKTQDETIAVKDKEIERLTATLAEKNQQIRNITDIATGATAINALRKAEEREHRSILEVGEKTASTLEQMLAELRRITEVSGGP